MIRVLFVCMGNICRSPTAEGVFRKLIREHGLDRLVEVASAGTHGYHIGQEPDQRAQRAAASRGYDLSSIRARKIAPKDFGYFDFVLAMDRGNLESLRLVCPVKHHDRLGLLMHYAKSSTSPGASSVPANIPPSMTASPPAAIALQRSPE